MTVVAITDCDCYPSPTQFLRVITKGRVAVSVHKNRTIFSQGSPSDAVYFVQKGRVKLTVASTAGTEAMIGMAEEGDFFGEGCLTGQPTRPMSAVALEDCSLTKIAGPAMKEALQQQPGLASILIQYLVARSILSESDFIERIFAKEKRSNRRSNIPQPAESAITRKRVLPMPTALSIEPADQDSAGGSNASAARRRAGGLRSFSSDSPRERQGRKKGTEKRASSGGRR